MVAAMDHQKKAWPTAYRWLLHAFLAGAALFAFLLAVATWPLWLPLLESDAGRFERVFGRPPPASAELLGSASEYGYDFEQVVVAFRLAETDFRAFLPGSFRPVAAGDLTDRIAAAAGPPGVSPAAMLRGCPQLEGWQRAPWPDTGFDVVSNVAVLYCADSARAYAAAHGLN